MAMYTVHDLNLGGTALKQVNSSRLDPRTQITAIRASGQPNATGHTHRMSEPQAQAQTFDIAGVLSLIAPGSGQYITSGGIDIPYAEHANGSTFTGAGANAVIVGTKGLAVINSIEDAVDSEAATATVDVYLMSSDGDAAPYVINVDQDLAAVTSNGLFHVRKILVDGSAVTNWTSVTVNTGLTITKHPHQAFPYPKEYSLTQIDPFVDITFSDQEAANSLGEVIAQGTSLTVYFQKKALGAAYVAPATTDHASVSFADCVRTPTDISGQFGQPASNTVRVYGEALSASSGIAIP